MLSVRRAEPGRLLPDHEIPRDLPVVFTQLLPDPQVSELGPSVQYQPRRVLQGVPGEGKAGVGWPRKDVRSEETDSGRDADQRGDLPESGREGEGYLHDESC